MKFQKLARQSYVDRVMEIRIKRLDRGVVIERLIEAGLTPGSAHSTATYFFNFIDHPETFDRFAKGEISLTQARKEMAIGDKRGRTGAPPKDGLEKKLLAAAEYAVSHAIAPGVFGALASNAWKCAIAKVQGCEAVGNRKQDTVYSRERHDL
jgi:hypothetical protein